MKLPKFILTVGGSEFVIPHNKGVSALMALMADAVPVDFRRSENTITLQYENEPASFTYVTQVSCLRIPPGVRWLRKATDGAVQEVRPVTKASKALPAKKAPQLRAPKKPQVLQLEF